MNWVIDIDWKWIAGLLAFAALIYLLVRKPKGIKMTLGWGVSSVQRVYVDPKDKDYIRVTVFPDKKTVPGLDTVYYLRFKASGHRWFEVAISSTENGPEFLFYRKPEKLVGTIDYTIGTVLE